jgi:hypothetical protein
VRRAQGSRRGAAANRAIFPHHWPNCRSWRSMRLMSGFPLARGADKPAR